MRGRKEEWPGAMIKKLDKITGAADVSAERADGFGESPHLNVNTAMDIEVVDGPTSAASQNARGVSVVDHHDGIVFFSEVAKGGQGADVTVHGEDTVGDDELASGLVFDRGELLLGVSNIFMAEDQDLGAGKTRAINDRGVVQLVGDDEIFFAKNGRDGAGVGCES